MQCFVAMTIRRTLVISDVRTSRRAAVKFPLLGHEATNQGLSNEVVKL